MALFIYQLKQALLSLKQKPTFVFSVVTTMGITLGALLCVLTLAYVMLIKPLPYPEQEKLFVVKHEFITEKGQVDFSDFPYPSAISLYEKNSLFDLSAITIYSESIVSSLDDKPAVHIAAVTEHWFTLFGVNFIFGRGFEQSEAINQHNAVAIISYKLWLDHFESTKDILDKKLTISGVSYSIIGVLDKRFIEPQIHGVEVKNDIWLPFDFNDISESSKAHWGSVGGNIEFVGQLKNGVSIAQANEKLTNIIDPLWQENVAHIDFFKGWHIQMSVLPVKNVILGNITQAIYLLLVGVIGLVIIAAMNITNLFISYYAEQQRTLSIHAALGATKKHLFNVFFMQTSCLMLATIMIALNTAWLGFVVIKHFFIKQLPLVDMLMITPFTYIAAIFLVLLFSLIFSSFSRKVIKHREINVLLQSSGKGVGFQISQRVRKLLILSQVAVVTLLVFINIVIFKNSADIINIPLGFSTDNNIHLSLTYSASSDDSYEERSVIFSEFKSKLQQLPQVELVSQSSSPLGMFYPAVMKVRDTNQRLNPERKYVDNNYFSVIEQPIIEGRSFTAEDIKANNKVIIVNEVLANRLANNGSALGTEVILGDNNAYRIIGVVKGVKIPGAISVPMRMYRPSELYARSMLVKLKEGQQLTKNEVSDLLATINSQWLIFGFENLTQIRSQRLFTQQATIATSSILTFITLFLAAIGLYGVLNIAIQMRRFEIGTRMAIGAKGRDIIALVIKENASAILIGVAVAIVCLIGLYLGFSQYLAQFINTQLIFVAVITLLAIASVTFIACYLPLKRYIKQPVVYCLKNQE